MGGAMTNITQLPRIVNLDVYHGDSWWQPFRFRDEDGDPVDLTDAIVASWARASGGDVFPLELNLEFALEGIIEIGVPDEGLEVGLYRYDVEVTFEDNEVLTWVRGRLHVRQDVTNA